MESLLARALESKLKYWLRSFSREQFKLQGRSVLLHNLDIDGDVLHSTLGLPPSLSVAQATVGKLELKIPYISNVKSEPIVVEIDKLDLVLAEKLDVTPSESGSGNQINPSGRSTGYGFADQIADGMTIQVGTVNLMLETRGGSREGAAWTPPLASITLRGLILYTTNEHFEVVNLKEARNFSYDKKCIYVFKKLEWQSFSIDLLPHPDMFDERLSSPGKTGSERGKDGAKRLFFGGERFIDNISGTAYITMHRTEQNNPLGLEVQLLIPEAVCPALSEPGLRALLRFMTGFYVCLNRSDVDPTSTQINDETPSRTLVGVSVEHIFLGIKDVDIRLELLAQSLRFSRASIPEGGCVKTIGKISLGGLFLRDTFSRPPCILIQPSMVKSPTDAFSVPTFASGKCWPIIYPLQFQHALRTADEPVISLYSCQIIPSPLPPTIASQTVIQCQPLQIYLQEKSCLQIASFLADGISVEPGVVRPNTSLSSMYVSLRQFDLTIPMKKEHLDLGFTGARLHVEGLVYAESPTLSYRLLKLDNDPACFGFWKGQPPDSSQRRWIIRANQLTVALETGSTTADAESSPLWNCIELREPAVEVAVATADGLPLLCVPPPGGIMRLGLSCQHFISNSSVQQLLFVLEMYSYLEEVGQALLKAEKSTSTREYSKSLSFGGLIEAAPSDSAVTLALDLLEIKFLESAESFQGSELVKLIGSNLRFKVTHRTLGGAIAVTSTLFWHRVRIECLDTECEQSADWSSVQEQPRKNMRAIFWVDDGCEDAGETVEKIRAGPFLDISVMHVMPYTAEDVDCHSLKVTAKVSGVRLGGGLIYSESLLHRFGVFGPDGGPGEELRNVLSRVSKGPLAHLVQVSKTSGTKSVDPTDRMFELARPDNIEVDVQLRDWLFALEGIQLETKTTDECWHSTFKCLHVQADHREKRPRVTIKVEGLQALKPRKRTAQDSTEQNANHGLAFEVRLAAKDGEEMELGLGEWIVDSLRASVKEPIEMEATKDELDFLVEVAKAEAEAASRITVGLLRLLKLQGSLGQAAIEQLSSLGSGSLDRYMSPERSRRASSISDHSSTSTPCSSLKPREGLNNVLLVDRLEESISKSLQLCKTVEKDMVETATSGMPSMMALRKELNHMQGLVHSLRF